MTEAQAYDVLGWPHQGFSDFILPVTGSTEIDWVPFSCVSCSVIGVSREKALAESVNICPKCGNKIVIFSRSVS